MKIKSSNISSNINIDLVVIALVFIAFIITGARANYSAGQEKVNKVLLDKEIHTNKLHAENEALKKENERLREDLKLSKQLEQIKKEFSQLKRKNRELVLALSYTESNWDAFVIHDEWNTVGKCGVRPIFWGKILAEKNIPINSLMACEAIYEILLEKHDGNKLEALKDYKGAKTNFASAKKVLELEKIIKKKRILS